MTYERLSAADAAFLHLETPHEPQHVGSLSILESGPLRDVTGRVRFEEIRDHVERRLARVPRLRQRIMAVPLNQGRPVWVDDRRFDIDYHVRLTSLPRPGDDRQLAILMSRLQAQALDRSRPLWEMWLVDGLAGDEIGMILKTHHAMGDGIASVDMALALVDLVPDPPVADDDPDPADWRPRAAPSPNRLLADAVRDQMSRPGRMTRAALGALRDPRQLVAATANVAKMGGELVVQPDPAPWNVPVSPHRRWVHADVDLEAVRQVRAHRDVTINDVVLAACTGALRTFLLDHGADVADRVLKAMVPVSLRTDHEHGARLGNRVSMLMVQLPVDESDPLVRLDRIHEHCARVKSSGIADGADLIVRFADGLPMLAPSLTRLLSRRVPMNLIITNIPGPPVPLYLLGARILRTYPYVEVIDHEGLTIAVVSYGDQLFFGLTADRDVMADLHRVAEAIEQDFAALADAVVR